MNRDLADFHSTPSHVSNFLTPDCKKISKSEESVSEEIKSLSVKKKNESILNCLLIEGQHYGGKENEDQREGLNHWCWLVRGLSIRSAKRKNVWE